MSTAVKIPGTAAALAQLSPVGLAELQAQAALMARVDRKYVLALGALQQVLGLLPRDCRVLTIGSQTQFQYESTYFDTPEHTSFYATAYQRRRRFKARTRTYVDSGEQWLEVKTRGIRGNTTKVRMRHEGPSQILGERGRDFVGTQLADYGLAAIRASQLEPVISTRFTRITLFDPESASRTTIDTGLRWWVSDIAEPMNFAGAVVETKTTGRCCRIDQLLWDLRIRPASFSKFAFGLTAFYPQLPANRWHRYRSWAAPQLLGRTS